MQKQISTLLKHGSKTLKHSVVRGRKTHISKKKSQITLKKLRGGSETGFKPKVSFRTSTNSRTGVSGTPPHQKSSVKITTGKPQTAATPQPSKEKEPLSYFFVKCYDNNGIPVYTDLDETVLEAFFTILGVNPDKEIVNMQEFDKDNTYKTINDKRDSQDKRKQKPVRMPQSEFCYKFPYFTDIPKYIYENIQAEIFIYNINSLHMNKRYDSFNKYLVNMFNKDITKKINKYALTTSFNGISVTAFTLFIPNTIKINDLNLDSEKPKWYVLRPIDGYGGKDIYYVNSPTALKIAKDFYDNNNIYGPSSTYKSYGNNVIASEYITTPLLFKTLKCHLRLYYLVFYSKTHNVFNSFYLEKLGKIFTAGEPFTMANESFMNTEDDKLKAKKTHDTHTNSTADDYFYPEVFTHENITLSDGKTSLDKTEFNEKFEDMKNQIKLIMSIISEIMVKKCTDGKCNELLYDTDNNAYHIFGIDIMIDGGDGTNPNEKFTPKLIEINFAPGFGHKNKDLAQKRLSDEVYGWINATVLEPLLKPLDPLDQLKPLEVQKPDETTIKKRLYDIRTHSTYIKPYNELEVKTDYGHADNHK